MKVYIEVLFILAALIVIILWKLWYMFSTWRLAKKYNPQNDKSRKGGVFDEGAIRATEQRVVKQSNNTFGYEQPEGRKLLQETATNNSGKNSNSSRNNSSPIRKLFHRNSIK